MSNRQQSRRGFIKTSSLGTLALGSGLAGRPGRAQSHVDSNQHSYAHSVADLATEYELAARALEAARAAGASYADARLSYTKGMDFVVFLMRKETLGIGVRALVDGFWGFASGPVWRPDEAVRVGREAVAQARLGALGARRPVELAPMPVVRDGSWSTPVKRDPFEIAVNEIRDWIDGTLHDGALRLASSRIQEQHLVKYWCSAMTKRVTFASSEGSRLTQTFTTTNVTSEWKWGPNTFYAGPGTQQGGWEVAAEYPWEQVFDREVTQIETDQSLPQKPVDVGRHQVVFAPKAMAVLLGETLGRAAQIDRALGYEANARGTSFLGPDPMRVLGSVIAGPGITVTAERSTPRALGTTRWDDEGVEPAPFTLVQNGVFVDYQTTREQAAWLAPWYAKQNMVVRSRGCASAPDAEWAAMQHAPNLVMTPNAESLTLDDLVGSVKSGLLVMEASEVTADFQCLNGGGAVDRVYEIKNGRRVGRVSDAGILFRSPELWKNIMSTGGTSSAAWVHALPSSKGEPEQTVRYSVCVVPSLVKDVAVVNPRKRT